MIFQVEADYSSLLQHCSENLALNCKSSKLVCRQQNNTESGTLIHTLHDEPVLPR